MGFGVVEVVIVWMWMVMSLQETAMCNRMAPDTASCQRHRICNLDLCDEVCVEGTVVIDEWAGQSLQFQRSLQRNMSLFFYEMQGTHNGYQTQHSGLGVEEKSMYELFLLANYSEPWVVLANQRYSILDQLRMGLRWIEMDIWSFVFLHDDVRLCHDPFGDPRLIFWVDRAANETGTDPLQWDPANLGCFSTHNNNLKTGLEEVNDWLIRPENQNEIVVIYYDAKTLFTDNAVTNAVIPPIEVFGDRIFTPADKERYFPERWPTANEISALGKQVIVECGSSEFQDNELASQTIFSPTLWSGSRGGSQFGISSFEPFPDCLVGGEFLYGNAFHRALDTSIAKGPASQPNPNSFLYPEDIRNLAECGVPTTAMDNAQPSYTQHMIWSWDVNQPIGSGCVMMNANGRWQVQPNCSLRLRFACVSLNDHTNWVLSQTLGVWDQPACPAGFVFSVPRTGYSNSRLKQLANGQQVWLLYSLS